MGKIMYFAVDVDDKNFHACGISEGAKSSETILKFKTRPNAGALAKKLKEADITNVSTFDMGEDEIIEFYRQRATAENYIREQKYGFDFLNFPCQKLRANQVFGQAGSITHNLIRALSFMMKQKVKKVKGKDGKRRVVTQLGYFSKKVRSELIKIAGKVVSSARKIKLRLSRHNWEVFEKMMLKINETKQRYVPYKTLSELFNNRILERPT
ncbi:MAG: transposase [Bacteriovoracaceae bacterium]